MQSAWKEMEWHTNSIKRKINSAATAFTENNETLKQIFALLCSLCIQKCTDTHCTGPNTKQNVHPEAHNEALTFSLASAEEET